MQDGPSLLGRSVDSVLTSLWGANVQQGGALKWEGKALLCSTACIRENIALPTRNMLEALKYEYLHISM